ncbi:MupG family TIM beta-alpha barrel fold protein [uncultured Anaerococcus sp.]|uniref:MupG family TIM beta-alpha barrel fold protein n=1 Tax=uncultured Anaerococcus sp. TaxID=293428 RepID=UPI0028894B48|nr:MupG family TIM beta-alpha barrel fold protein [uncultured Anaerococcus sp.]
MLGFSLYFDKDYDLDKALDRFGGFDLLFTSIHYQGGKEVLAKFSRLYDKAKERGLRVCVDLNKEVLDENPDLLSKDLIIRLDYGFSPADMANLSKRAKISINASTIACDLLEEIMGCGANKENILAIHNFYPLDFTGLAVDFFKKRNDLFKSFGIEVAAFVPGNTDLRGPVYKSLPSLEGHRMKNPYTCYLDLVRTCGLTSVIIAEGISDRELSYIKAFKEDGTISLRVSMDEPYKSIKGMKVRSDLSDYIIRNERCYKNIPSDLPAFVKKGDILICNEKSGRYSGELELAKKDLGLVYDRNIIGKVSKAYVDVLDYIEGGDELVFDRR